MFKSFKSILVLISMILILPSLASATEMETEAVAQTKTISCTCEAEVGIPGLSEFTETISIAVQLESEGLSEATSAEVNIVVAYQCLQEKADVRRISAIKDISCQQ